MKTFRKILILVVTWYKTLRVRYRIWYFESHKKGAWSKGYFEYKWREIIKSIYDDEIALTFETSTELPRGYGLGLDERIVEYPWLLSQLPAKDGYWLDAGSILNFQTILNHSKLSGKKLSIVTLVPETSCFWYKDINYLYSDIRDLPFKDNLFDGVVCISTLEHVGMDNSMVYTRDKTRNLDPRSYLKAIGELKRVLKPGGVLLLTMPFGKHEDFGFFQQFDVSMIDEITRVWGAGLIEKYFYAYSEAGWQVSSQDKCSSKSYFDIRTGRHRGKDRAAAARAVICLRLKK